jgi:uncharacterized protein YfiM (DUF2279 family)
MRPRHAAAAALALALNAGVARANESFASEFSHFVAGGVVAGTVTAIADHYEVPDRAWVGFGVTVGISFVAEAVQVISVGSSQVGPSALDFFSNMAGAAIGAWVTDQYILQPVVTRDAAGHTTVGVVFRKSF